MGLVAPYFTSEIKNVFLRGFATMCCITITILPVSVIFFNETSLISPLTNLVLIPICSISIVLGIAGAFFCALGLFAYPLIYVAGILCKFVLRISEIIGKIPVFYVNIGKDYITYLVILTLVIVILVFIIYNNRKTTSKILIYCLSLMVISCTIISIYSNNIQKIAILGTNYDTSVVISTGNKAQIIDYGGEISYKYVVKYAIENGLTEFDIVLLGNESYARQKYKTVLKSYKINSIVKKDEENIVISKNGFTPDLKLVNIEYIFNQKNEMKARKIT
jgi:hypothetical protein